jgi:ketosteroid isomerase-like protein
MGIAALQEFRMSTDPHDFQSFLKQRAAAAGAYVSGDFPPVSRVLAHDSPASFFGPGGGHVDGAQAVAARYEHDVASFEPGGENRLEILHAGASGDLGYWVGHQRARARLKGKPEPVPMDLRVTELFRHEAGGWKLIHRHADMGVSEQKKRHAD